MGDDKHQAALDGIRGFAAISVVLFHIGRWLDEPLALNSGLAVDLFFLLSGYVLTGAYAGRLNANMSVKRFVILRLVRLMPLVVLGTLISAAYIILRVHMKHEDLAMSALVTATLLGALNLPYLTAPLAIGGNQVFPLNGPQYSLFLEVVVNVVWAAVVFLRKGWPAGILAVTCFVLVAAIGVLGGDTPETFVTGFPRVGASFLAGVAIFHLNLILPAWRWWPTIFWACCAIILGTFYAPSLPFGLHIAWVVIVSPLLVLSGARTVLRGKVRTLALLAGRLSYPIYVLHYPLFTWMNGIFQMLAHRKDAAMEGSILVVVVIVASLAALRFYDEPVRYKLSSLLKRPVNSGSLPKPSSSLPL